MRHLLSILVLSFIFISCATTDLPPVTGKDIVYEDDEKRLWLRSQEEQNVLNESGLLYENREIVEYLNAIAAKLHPPQMYEQIPFKILVLKDPHFNAFAFPNGVIYVHTGIVARAENEAQIATLLAHEMTHCTHRHAVKNFRSTKNKTAVFATIQVAAGGLGGGVGDLVNILGSVGTMAAVTGYSRELETEADVEGLKRMTSAGYDPGEAPKLFVHLQKEVKVEEIKESFFFGSHPRLQERIKNYERLIDSEYASSKGGLKNADVFLEKVHDVILDNAILDLKLGRFEFAQEGVKKYLQISPDQAKAYYVLGEIFNQKGEEGGIEKSIDFFEQSIAIDPSFPEACRELGLIYYKKGDKSLAKKYLQQYLSLSQDAPDKLYIEHYLKQLD
jgi:predicted Zn-dependent protease